MLTPTQLQQVREKIILARNPECKTIEEAMEKEWDMFSKDTTVFFRAAFANGFVGLPLDLASVLNALGEDYVSHPNCIYKYSLHPDADDVFCDWQLLKDGKPCAFDEQTEKTKFEIARVLGII